MTNDRIKYAMNHLSRKEYTNYLAQPNWRRLQRRNVHILSNPYGIRRGALRSRASKRIKVMAKPKYLTKKYDPEMLLANLKFQTSANIAETLSKVQHSRYRRYRFFCNERQRREMRKKQRIMARLRRYVKPDEWKTVLETMKRLATPKVPPRPKPLGKKKKWRPVNMRRIVDLSTPVSREGPEARDPTVVPRSALTYRISRRMVEISCPRSKVYMIPTRYPGMVSPAALRAVATPRLVELAKAVDRPAGMETDLKENAFMVSPQALKARCSRRLKFLARPKRYK